MKNAATGSGRPHMPVLSKSPGMSEQRTALRDRKRPLILL